GNSQQTVLGSNLYFNGYDTTNGYSLWKTDGNTASSTGTGTVQTGAASPFNNYPTQLTVVGTKLYFFAYNSADGGNFDLWKTDGTSAGTAPVQTSGYARGVTYNGNYPAALGTTKVLFTAYDVDATTNSPHGWEPWVSDGTNVGTAMLTDINTTTYDSSP